MIFALNFTYVWELDSPKWIWILGPLNPALVQKIALKLLAVCFFAKFVGN